VRTKESFTLWNKAQDLIYDCNSQFDRGMLFIRGRPNQLHSRHNAICFGEIVAFIGCIHVSEGKRFETAVSTKPEMAAEEASCFHATNF